MAGVASQADVDGRAAGTRTMRAAVLAEPRRFEVQEVAIPEPTAGQVLIRLEGCGVCASNIPPFEGRDWFNYPMEAGALGHEGWGVVEELADGVTGVEVGDRVAFIGSHSYAQYEVADAASVVKIPDSMTGQPFPGEPLGCAMNIFKRADVQPGDRVAVIGIGFLGALLTQLCANAGATVIAIARKPYALDIAKRMGAAETVLMDDHSRIIEEVKRLTGPGAGEADFTGYRKGELCDVVIECVGKQWPLDLAGEITKERGRLVIAGFHQDGLRTFNGTLWNWRGLDVINAHERDPQVYIQGIRDALAAVERGELNLLPLYTHRFSLNDLTEALTLTQERPDGFMKALIGMEG